MSDSNPSATTWKFIVSVYDQDDPSVALAIPQVFVDDTRIHYAIWQLERYEQGEDHYKFIRGVVRCHKPLSLRQINVICPAALKVKPLRGIFQLSNIDYVLTPRNRIGDLYRVGVTNIQAVSHKRPSQVCTHTCVCCLIVNKRSKK